MQAPIATATWIPASSRNQFGVCTIRGDAKSPLTLLHGTDCNSVSLMPRFWFEIHDGRSSPDIEGIVLPDLEDAQHEAVRRAGTLMSCHPREFWHYPNWAIDVTDDAGLVLFTLSVSATWHLGKVDVSAGT